MNLVFPSTVPFSVSAYLKALLISVHSNSFISLGQIVKDEGSLFNIHQLN